MGGHEAMKRHHQRLMSILIPSILAGLFLIAMPTPIHSPAGLGFRAAVKPAQADPVDRRRARRAARGAARRADRRQDRREAYLESLPTGCVTVRLGGVAHWRCGTLYYRPVVRSGRTVYVIVDQ